MRILAISGARSDQAALFPVADAVGGIQFSLDVPLSNTNADTARSFAIAAGTICNKLCDHQPDFVLIAGDRFEILAAASVSHLFNVGIGHIGGGDITEGSLDNGMRHAITKLAHLHFTSCKSSGSNIIGMGEEPWRVSVTGDPAIDGLESMELYSRDETISKLGVGPSFILVAYQPSTLLDEPLAEADQLLMALQRRFATCIFTPLNADPWGKVIDHRFRNWCVDNMGRVMEMDRKLYLSAVKHCKVMVGNSSSGLYEAPSLKKAFVNVGDRQKGRPLADSVITVVPHVDSIVAAMAHAEKLDCTYVTNPYGDGHATERIVKVLNSLPDRNKLLTKKTGDLSWLSTQYGREYIAHVAGADTQRKSWLDGPQESSWLPPYPP